MRQTSECHIWGTIDRSPQNFSDNINVELSLKFKFKNNCF